jgi:hypothetical protein
MRPGTLLSSRHQITPPSIPPGVFRLTRKPRGDKPENPPEYPWGESSFEFSPTYQPTLGADEHGLCNPNKWGLTTADYERWRGYADVFGLKGATQPKPHGRDEMDTVLDGIVRSASELYAPDVVRSAIPRLLDAVGAKIAKERREAGRSKGTGITAMRGVAQGQMITECKRVKEDRARVAEDAAEKAPSKSVRAHERSSRRGRASIDDVGDALIQEAMEGRE